MQIRYRIVNETTLSKLYHNLGMIDNTHIINQSDNNEASTKLDKKYCYVIMNTAQSKQKIFQAKINLNR